MVVMYIGAVVSAAHFTTSINVSFGAWWAFFVSAIMGVSAVLMGILRGTQADFWTRIPTLANFRCTKRAWGRFFASFGGSRVLVGDTDDF